MTAGAVRGVVKLLARGGYRAGTTAPRLAVSGE